MQTRYELYIWGILTLLKYSIGLDMDIFGYHGKLDPAVKNRADSEWRSADLNDVVLRPVTMACTCSYGMGINQVFRHSH